MATLSQLLTDSLTTPQRFSLSNWNVMIDCLLNLFLARRVNEILSNSTGNFQLQMSNNGKLSHFIISWSYYISKNKQKNK